MDLSILRGCVIRQSGYSCPGGPGCLIFVSRSHRKDDLPFPLVARSAFYQKIQHIFLVSAK